MEIQHFFHKKHPLRYMEEVEKKVEEDETDVVRCYGCGESVLGAGPSYGCGECNLFMHKECAEMPEKLTHEGHPEHELTLLAMPAYDAGYCICSICPRNWRYFTYNCSSCEFDVCINCAFEELSLTKRNSLKPESAKHKSHPHVLTLLQKPATFECDACHDVTVEDKQKSYLCNTCGFWIHESCAKLPFTFDCNHHDHPLKLAFCLPEQYRHLELKCDMCHEWLRPSHWVYYCANCRYFLHIKCATSKANTNLVVGHDHEVEKIESLIHLPSYSGSELAIELFVTTYNPDEKFERLTTIEDFSHEHPLILCENEHKNGQMDKLLCNGCIQPISGSYYTCGQCSYFLHLYCSLLPPSIHNHPLHPQHSMVLFRNMTFFILEKCNCCSHVTNGFFYQCEECEFSADIRCVSLPTVIAHSSHKHPLTRKRLSAQVRCNSCGHFFSENSFVCELCDFHLHYNCALLPLNVRHRWDKHPLNLSYPPYSYHPDDFLCELCEKEIHPKFWMYHCRECDYSFHLYCIPQLKNLSNVKFGGNITVSSHPHSLTFVRYGTFKLFCADCGDRADEYEAFECVPCKFSICLPCLKKIA